MNERFSCVELPSCSDMAAHISCGGLNWVNTCGGEIVSGAIKGGNRPGEPLYVARVLAPDGQYHPCKAAQSHGEGAHYHYDNAEKVSYQYDLLVVTDPSVVTLTWVKARNGEIPAYAVQGERSRLYIGRCPQAGELVVGEVNPSQRVCIVVTCWNAYRHSEYEVLCAIPHASIETSSRSD